MAKRGRGAELNALRQKKKDEKTGSTTKKSQSSVSSNKNGGGRTGGLTRQQVQQKVSRSAGYTSSGKAKQPSTTQQANPYSTTQNNARRSRINGSVARGRQQTPIDRRQTAATAAEMRRQQEEERLSRTSTGRQMLKQKEAENKAKAQTTAEWNDVKKLSKEEQQEWFNQKMTSAQDKSRKGTIADWSIKDKFHRGELDWDKATLKEKTAILYQAAGDTAEHTVNKMGAEYESLVRSSADRMGEHDPFLRNVLDDDERKKAEEKNLKKLDKAKGRITNAEMQLEQDKKELPWLAQRSLEGQSSFLNMLPSIALGGGAKAAGISSRVGLLDIYARTQENERGKVKAKADNLRKQLEESGNYTTEELDEMFKNVDLWDLANSHVQGALEAGTELLGEGVGPVKYLAGGKGILDKIAGRLLTRGVAKSGIGRSAANLVGGIAGEITEEEINGPAGAFASNLIYGNKFQEFQEDSIRRSNDANADTIQSMLQTPEDLQLYLANIHSDEFFQEMKDSFKEGAASDEEATKLANLAINYYEAAAENDRNKMRQYSDELVELLAGGDNSLKEAWTMQDAINVAASTGIMVAATGAPGTITTAEAGNAYVKNNGLKSVGRMAGMIERYDSINTSEGKAVKEAAEAGSDISGTQVFGIIEKAGQVGEENLEREKAGRMVAHNQMAQEDLRIDPFQYNEDGTYSVVAPETAKRYETIRTEAIAKIEESEAIDLDNGNAETLAEIKAAFDTGAITVNEIDAIISNDEVKQGFEELTGINLDQYTVKTRGGKVDQVKTNIAVQEGLLALAADNYVESARIEQEAWNDTTRGKMADRIGSGFNPVGDVAIHDALESVDPRDPSKFMLMARVAQEVYNYSFNTQGSWDEVKHTYHKMYPSLDIGVLEGMYESAKQDRAEQETPYLNAKVEAGKPLGEVEEGQRDGEVRGSLINEDPYNEEYDTGRDFTSKQAAALKTMATNLGVDIIQVEATNEVLQHVTAEGKVGYANALVDFRENKIYISSQAPVEKILHEIVHETARLAAPQYLEMAHFIMNAAYKRDPKGTQSILDSYKELYAGKGLNDVQIEEEVIADIISRYMNDEAFLTAVADENVSAIQKIRNAFDDVLRKIRSFLTSGKVYDNGLRDTLLNELGIYKDARDMMVRVYHQAVQNKAAQAIEDAQEQTNARDVRLSIEGSITDEEGNVYEQDSDYMDAVNRGDMETAQRMVDEAAAEAMPNTKLKGRWYHGTENEFTEFNFSQGGKNGHADGYGIYLTNDPEVASSYGTRMIEGYVNVERPASALDTTTLTNDELHRLIARTVNEEAERLLEEGYDNLGEAKFDTWISNYTDTRYAGDIDKAIDEVIDSITNINGNDYDIVLEIMTGMGIRDYDEASKFYDILTEETGIDGFETKWGDESEMADPSTPTIALAFRSNQIKDASPVTYDDDGNVIPLSERFNAENNDIRYSFTTDQEDLIKNGEIPKSLRDWAKEIGLDEISKQPTKGPVEVSVKSLRSAWFQKDGREDEAEVVNTVLDTIGKSLTNMIGKYNYIDLGDAVNASVHYRTDKDGKPVSVILTCQVKNAEYEVNFDFTTICSKRLAMQRVLERFIKTEGESKGTLYDELKLDEEGMYKLRLILEKAGFEVSCKGCFVEQNRYSQQGQAKTIADDWNKAIDEWEKEHNEKITENFDLVNMDINALDYDEIQEAFNNYSDLMAGRDTNVETKNRTLIEAHPFFRKRMNPSDYASMAGQRALMAIGVKQFRTKDGKSKKGTTLYGLLKRGQSDSKQSVPFTAYNGEISLLPDKMKGRDLADYLMSIGGARAQSASDFQIEFFYDYMQLVADLSARGLPMHMYTKVIELAELFGMTGVKINLSAMCDVDESLGGEYAGLKLVDGEYVYNISDQSIDYDKAVELQKKPGYSKNIGIIMVALSKQHMLKSLDDPDVRYIIGYHSSSMPAVVAQMTNMGNATDYTKLNKTNKLNDKGKALFAKAMEQAKGKTKLAKYKDALRIFDDMIQAEVANSGGKIPRRGNEYARYMSAYGGNTAEFNTYDDLKKSNDARKTADNYIEWCMKNDLVPIYFPFAFHENYYKCEIYDFNMYDNVSGEYAPMEAVQNIYPGLDMTKGETDTTAFMDTVTRMMDERNDINRDLDSMYDNVFDEAKEELKFSISGDEYMDFDEAGIDRTELTPRADATKTEDQLRDEAYMDAYFDGDDDAMQELVDEAAKRAGYTYKAYHHTEHAFTVFDRSKARRSMDIQGFYFSSDPEAEREYGSVRYDVYLKIEKPYVVDSSEAMKALPFDFGTEDAGVRAREWLQENGYDAVIRDAEYYGSEADEIIVFEPEQIKSSEPMLFEDDPDGEYGEGEVIPLSQRFDPSNPDIRYSLPTQDSDGNILTDGQMDYFKNSQARDEQGRLVPVYHTTNKGGFTVFDPMRSDDHRSLFFASNWDVSQTYGNYANSRFYKQEINTLDDVKKFLDAYSPDRYFITQEQFEQAGGWEADFVDFENVTKGEQSDFEQYLENPDGYIAIIGVPDHSPDHDSYSDDWIRADSPNEIPNEIRNHMNFLDANYFGKERGYYACYLNLENPMIVDANGDYWNAIHYDDGVRIQDDAIYKFNQIKITHNEEGINLLIFGESKDADELWSNFKVNESFDDTDGLYEYLLYTIGLDDNYVEDIFALANKEGNVNYWAEDYIGANGDLLDEEDYSENTYNTRQIASIAESLGHDGVIIRNLIDHGGKSAFDGIDELSDIYIAFSSNQVKDVGNENPTENPDIRYSIPDENEIRDSAARNAESIDDIPLRDPVLEEGRQRYSLSVEDFERMIADGWNERYRTFGRKLDDESVRPHLISMMRQIMDESGTGRKYKSEVLDQTVKDMNAMYFMMKKGMAEEFAQRAWESAERIVDNIDFNDDLYTEYKGMREYLTKRKIQIPDALVYDEDFVQLVRDNEGKMRFETKGTKVETAYKYMRKHYPELFTEDLEHPVDMLLQMDYVLQLTDPYRDAYTSEEYVDLVQNVAETLCEIVRQGEDYKSVADDLYEKFNARTKALKVRHQEAIRKLRQKEKGKTQRQKNRADKWKQKYQERIQKEKANKAVKKSQAEHRKSFEHILSDYNDLCKWVLEPTKEKNVPEEFRKSLAEFLQTLDLQTENSKKLEEKTGRVANKTFKLRELKDRLRDLSESKTDADGNYTPALFEVDANVDFLLQKLADKVEKNGNTIDALDNEDIRTIEVFMKLLIRNIKRYKEVKLETKMAELNDIGERCVTFLRDKRDRDGIYGKREGLPGVIETINATALTPAYLFDRMGPLKEMYDVLRHNGFDTYIRNEKMIIDRMSEILSGYYKGNEKKPRPGSEIETWRDNRSEQTIELESGKTVTMTVAQMMSLYCLVNRGTQATDHMTVGGIVVTPIQEGSKIQQKKDKLRGKRKAETSQKRVLTEADMQNIIAKLTPEQTKLADQLQELMSTDMARLGNEAHRDLYGYNNFNDPNYFPIKVSGNELKTDINNIGDVVEKIKSYGPAKPVTPKAKNALVIDDIFTVVADHCNGMNLYNAYLVPITDFMKVLNYTHTFEDGEVLTMKDAIEQAYGKDVLKYVMNLMKDINGIKGDNRGGLEGIMNKALGLAKRAAVFGNIRVALQQPTAIVRAAAEIDPKYFAGIKLNVMKGEQRKAVYEEMYRYCPIALWKSWGFYDTYMGRDLEDVMMNAWSMSDAALAGIYGALDNATWSGIWQAVKKEQMDKHPEMDHKSEEFLQMCGRRASEVFDKTQVVDSTFHRSDAMRNRQVAVKVFTAFMAEPTLTLNVFRAALFNASELRKAGDKAGAAKVLARALGVLIAQAITVSAAQAFADAWRGKDPGLPWGDDDDDDDKENGYWVRWLHNFLYNCIDQAHLENNVYLVKDVTPYINYVMSKAADYGEWNPLIRAIMGWDQDYLYSQNNLIFASFENTANGVAQAFKKLEKGEEYDKDWYDILQKIASGIGNPLGFPAGTLMRDFKPIWDKIVPAAFAADEELLSSSSIGSESSESDKKSGSSSGSDSDSDTSESKPHEGPSGKYIKGYDKEAKKIAERVADLSGVEREKATWEKVREYIKEQEGLSVEELVAEGRLKVLEDYRDMYTGAGNTDSYFDERIVEACKSEFKKTINYDPSPGDAWKQTMMRRFMTEHGMTDSDVSAMVYKSETARDLKVAMRIGDKELIQESLAPLAAAGITQEDLDKLWDNRNRVDLKKYKDGGGRYADKLKSMGTFIWPTKGVVTSHFGYRDAPTAGASSNHPAIDIGASQGTPVVAADGGVVIYAGNNGGYGNSVGIKHDNGMVTYYNHLYAWNVKVGDTVGQGQQIAQVGSTGISTGPHLDFKILDKNGKPVDPEKYLN